MIETHPFRAYIPKNSRYLILGSFPGRRETRTEEWYYGTKRGQFWDVVRKVYGKKLENLSEKQKLFSHLNIAVSDVLFKIQRINKNNSDQNLKVIEYNTKTVERILVHNNIEKIFFSSRNVEKIFKSKFKHLTDGKKIELITLPSSSPRYARLNLNEKVMLFKKLLPKLES